MDFKDYKEKQQYYKNRAKNSKMIWVSTEPNSVKKLVVKGRTYIKEKGDK